MKSDVERKLYRLMEYYAFLSPFPAGWDTDPSRHAHPCSFFGSLGDRSSDAGGTKLVTVHIWH